MMMRGRLLTLAVFTAVVAAACGTGPDGPGPDGTDPTGVFTTPAPEPPPDVSLKPANIEPPNTNCVENDNFWGILVREDNVEILTQLLAQGKQPVADLGESTLLTGTGLRHYPDVTRAKLSTIVADLDNVLDYKGEEDENRRAVLILAALGLSPNYKLDSLRPNPRVNGGPFSAPAPVPVPDGVPDIEPGTKSVLIIDTGYDEAAVAPLNGSGAPKLVDGDSDGKVTPSSSLATLAPPFAGHGTFISGILAIDQPDKFGDIDHLNLWAADTPNSPGKQVQDNAYDSDFVSLVLGRQGNKQDYDGINLSVGSYPCSIAALLGNGGEPSSDPADYVQPIAQRIALEWYVEGKSDVMMAAAAGNFASEIPMFPAAFHSAPTPNKDALVYEGDATGEAAFLAWQSNSKLVAENLALYVHSVGALPGPDDTKYSNSGDWVEFPDVEGCHISLMPKGTWDWSTVPEPPPTTSSTITLDTGWAWWCGTSFAAPYWLTQNL